MHPICLCHDATVLQCSGWNPRNSLSGQKNGMILLLAERVIVLIPISHLPKFYNMETYEPSNFEKNYTRKYSWRILNYITYLLLPVLAILLMWSIVSQQKKTDELNRINQEKSTLLMEFKNLNEDYQMVKTWNKDYEEQITEHQNHIDRLIREIRFKSDDIEEYRQEMAGLRSKLNNYILRVDSLETSAEQSQEVVEILVNSRDSLVRKIQKASRLNAYNLEIRTENKRKKKTNNPKRVKRVNICFTLAENIFIESGDRDIYLRILRPDERLIYASEDDLFNANGQDLAYTGKVSVNYENTDTRVCILWKNISADLTEGLYYVNIYADGREIGSRSFLLKNGFLFF